MTIPHKYRGFTTADGSSACADCNGAESDAIHRPLTALQAVQQAMALYNDPQQKHWREGGDPEGRLAWQMAGILMQMNAAQPEWYDQITQLINRNLKLENMIRNLEWAGNDEHTECPSCRMLQWQGHAAYCDLQPTLEDAALRGDGQQRPREDVMDAFQKGRLDVELPEALKDDTVWLNSTYQVNVRNYEHPGLGRIVHLSIKRRDKEALHDWRALQWIKNQIVGPEYDAMEIYPAEDKLVDNANQYHLWALLDCRIPLGFQDRRVTEKEAEFDFGGRVKQRPFADYCRPTDLAEQEAQWADELNRLRDEITRLNRH